MSNFATETETPAVAAAEQPEPETNLKKVVGGHQASQEGQDCEESKSRQQEGRHQVRKPAPRI